MLCNREPKTLRVHGLRDQEEMDRARDMWTTELKAWHVGPPHTDDRWYVEYDDMGFDLDPKEDRWEKYKMDEDQY